MNKKAAILEASGLLFAQYGLKKTTIDEIALKAAVSKATLYKYYRNKEEIFSAVCDCEADKLRHEIILAVEYEKTASSKLRAHLLTRTVNLKELARYYRLAPEIWNEYQFYINSVQKRIAVKEIQMLRDIITFGNSTGEFAVTQVDSIAHLMIISLKSLEYPWALDGYNITLPEYVVLMTNIIIDGIGAKNKAI